MRGAPTPQLLLLLVLVLIRVVEVKVPTLAVLIVSAATGLKTDRVISEEEAPIAAGAMNPSTVHAESATKKNKRTVEEAVISERDVFFRGRGSRGVESS